MTPNYEARIRRAEYLSTTYPFAAEILAFYRRICVIQQKLSKELHAVLDRQSRLPAASGTLREQMDLELVLPFVKQALSDVMFFLLFQAGELLESRADEDLARRVKELLATLEQ